MTDRRRIERDFFVDTLRRSWVHLTPREKRRLRRIDSILAISLEKLIEGRYLEGLTDDE